MDRIMARGRAGLARTIPDGMEPGSDVANMSLLGYDPAKYHTGRGPLEAAAMGVRLGEDDVAFRCNLVTLGIRGHGGVPVMMDHSAGHISNEEARELVQALQPALEGTTLTLYPGVSYRHLLVWRGGPADLETTPPHDILGREADAYAAVYPSQPDLGAFVRRAQEILRDHPVNRRRAESGKAAANAVWPWGQGKAPAMPTLKERYGLSGAMISAVDLLKGLGVYAGLEPLEVPGATGYLDTNYAGKVEAALEALRSGDLVYLHVEAPDETGHEGDAEKKVEAIEAFDSRVVGPVMTGLESSGEVGVLLVTDHLTPVSVRTHVAEPVPFAIVSAAGSRSQAGGGSGFSERGAAATGWLLESGMELFDTFIRSGD
jgi:2,3-bisphosphoglycerate-independent phosphoglycerate mutase